HEGRLHHEEVDVELEDRAELKVTVYDQVPAQEQDEHQADLGEVLDQRREPGPQVGVLDIGPLDLVRRRRHLPELLFLGGERLDHAHAVGVLVDHGRHLRQAGLDGPRNGEQDPAHAHAAPVDERHRDHGYEGEEDVDGEHEPEGNEGNGALDEDQRGKREIHLHRADVGIGPRDQLSRLHAVVERERHASEVLVDAVAEVVLDVVRHLEQRGAGEVAGHSADDAEDDRPVDVEVQWHGGTATERVVDGVAEELGDDQLQDEAHEREDQRDQEVALVRGDDRIGPLDP